MKRSSLLAPALLAFMTVVLMTLSAGLAAQPVPKRTLESLAQQECLGAEPIRAVQTWASWATERDYRLVLSETGRVMLVLSPTYKRRAQGKKEDNTVERFLESGGRLIVLERWKLPWLEGVGRFEVLAATRKGRRQLAIVRRSEAEAP